MVSLKFFDRNHIFNVWKSELVCVIKSLVDFPRANNFLLVVISYFLYFLSPILHFSFRDFIELRRTIIGWQSLPISGSINLRWLYAHCHRWRVAANCDQRWQQQVRRVKYCTPKRRQLVEDFATNAGGICASNFITVFRASATPTYHDSPTLIKSNENGHLRSLPGLPFSDSSA